MVQSADNESEGCAVGAIQVHEFMSLDGVIDTPAACESYENGVVHLAYRPQA
jgi:hypothetical protein